MLQSTVGKLIPLVLMFVATSNPIFPRQPSSSNPTRVTFNCCTPGSGCTPDFDCVVSDTLR